MVATDDAATRRRRNPRADRAAKTSPWDDGGRMSLADHLRELRNRVVKSALAIVPAAVLAYLFYKPILTRITEPVCQLHVAGTGSTQCSALVIAGVVAPFSLALKIALYGGIIIASPVWLWQLWAFVAPGLHRHERRYSMAFVGAGVPFFLAGAAVAYWAIPRALDFVQGFVIAQASVQIPIDEYLSFFLRMVLLFGLAFEFPLVLMLLNVAGVLSGRRIRSWWRVMVFLIFLFAAIATPTGDPWTMCILAAPLCVLYVVAMGLALLNDRRREARRLSAPDAQLSDDEASALDLTPSRLDDELEAGSRLERAPHGTPAPRRPERDDFGI